MQQLNIALVVLQRGDEFLLQKRDHKASGAVDLIGAYGGKIEASDKTPLNAALRELSEETSLQPKPNQLKFLGKVDVICDYKGEPARVNAWSYILKLDDIKVYSKEGTLLCMKLDKVLNSIDEFTPGTRACFEQYILKGEKYHG